ncbi:MAG: putative Ig domain-containing protein [Chitinophagales bacterium]|nr:putative Ig domain-containing protein [Chitinophagales bacterium]
MRNFLLLLTFLPIFLIAQPVFRGAKIVGNYPNTFFLHTIAATGEKPIVFTAKELPVGLSLDVSSGIIYGTAPKAGIYKVEVSATNKSGTSTQTLELNIGEKLALTPPMGWNSWNVFTSDIDEKIIMEIADAMVNTGMRDAGYEYINIDDYWHADTREADGKPKVDEKKFPNGMKHVADYVHSKGLKLGIYSCASEFTCGRRFGGYGYEEIDAKTYAEWGIDLLKYDYCFAPWNRKTAIERYTKMGEALKNSGRSIVFSICEWGVRKPWKWGAAAGGSYWRTTFDIFDHWKGNNPFQLSVMQILKQQIGLEKYAAPGAWNDPDMLIVGNYGKGNATSARGKFKGLSDTEYQSHFALWCMLNSPLLSSCDLRNMNDATKNILLNNELIALNQDIEGKQATLVSKKKGIWVYKKELSDGVAYAVFNTNSKQKSFVVSELIEKKIKGTVKDLVSGKVVSNSGEAINLDAHQTFVFKVNR